MFLHTFKRDFFKSVNKYPDDSNIILNDRASSFSTTREKEAFKRNKLSKASFEDDINQRPSIKIELKGSFKQMKFDNHQETVAKEKFFSI